jgi:thiosulfate reductase cytochrome b subunit
MAESVHFPACAIEEPSDSRRHSLLVRITHWVHTLAFFGLLVSGIAILLAHPRLYWGETGSLGTPSLLDLPIPFKLGHSGWGRYLHFLSAWLCALAGLLYVLSGIFTGHFRKDLLPAKSSLAWPLIVRSVSARFHRSGLEQQEFFAYNSLQRLAYLGVIFVLFPLVVITGLGMSPAITSVIPVIVTIFGGEQSARTVHFFVSILLVLFLFAHVVMICFSGFITRMRAMISGKVIVGKSITVRPSPGSALE